MTYRIRVELMNNFEELREKRLILPYYVSLEFPDKQRKIISWWSHMIEAAIRFSHEAYLSPSQLEVIFTIHGLKPVPLPKVLALLSNSDDFQWRDRSRQDMINKQQTGIREIFATLFRFIIPQKRLSSKLTKYQSLGEDRESKVVSSNVMREELGKMKQLIQSEMGIENNISYDFIVDRLCKESHLSPKSIEYLVTELHNKSWVMVVEANKKKILLYSDEIADYLNQKWIDLQKIKFILKLNINNLTSLVHQKMKQENELLHQAKIAAASDKNKAKQILGKVLNIKKMKEQIEQRSILLQKKLSQIEVNQTNGKTIQILGDAQKLLKDSMCDPEKFEKIAEDNAEIQIHQRQMRMGFEQLNGNDDQLEDQVDQMMKQLQDVVRLKKKKQKESPAAKFVESVQDIGIDDILKMAE